MRDNEPLGIYEELQRRAEYYANQGEALRRRIVKAGPADNGACAQLSNPFDIGRALRLKNGGRPFYTRPNPGPRRRPVHADARLGLNILQVMQAVVLESGMSAGDMMSTSRHRRFSWPRQVAMWAIDRYCPEYSYPEIAYVFRKDHTTVMHAVRVVNDRLQCHHPATVTLTGNIHERLLLAAHRGD